MKSKREQELELEIKKLKKENEMLKKTVKLKNEKLKIQNEQLEDLSKENKTLFYKNKYELEKEKNKKLENQLKEKDDYIAKIIGQLNKNSTNSSKPSSSDGFKKKIHNFREKTNRNVGAQEGHEYHKPKLIDKPDEVVQVKKPRKCSCGGHIKYDKEKIRRQLIDLLTQYYVIEYQGQIGICEKCGKKYFPEFPESINNAVQYGESVKGLSMILSEYGNVTVDKIKDIIGILTNSDGPASGSIMYWKLNSYGTMESIMEDIKDEMLKSPVINHDETPFRVNGKQKYAIGAFTDNLSAIECNGGREKEAFKKMNILPRYGGILVGDHYAVNESFQGTTAFCNVHTTREAKGILDIRKDSMAKDYIDFMYKLKKEVEESPKNKLSKKRYEEVREEYIKLLEKWKLEFNNFMKGKKTEYYDSERRLINRLLEYVDGHLLFAKESKVPFSNNPAERGLRSVKNKVKVIGGFRSMDYADGYCNSLSIIQTAQKQNLNPCKVLGKIVSGQRKVFSFQSV